MTQHDDRVYLGQMLDSAREALTYVDGIDFADFAGDQMRQRAVIYVIQVIGEAARRVSADRRRSLLDIPWPKVISMRHKLVHDYTDINIDEVWRTANRDLPPLIEALELALTD